MIFICFFYSLCVWLRLISLLLPRIIPAAAEHRVDVENPPCFILGSTSCFWTDSGWGGVATRERRLGPMERRCEALICTPVITYWSSSHTRGMQNRFNMLQLYRGWCWKINNLISICGHDRACARRPVWACVTTHTCARGQPEALTPGTSSLPCVDDVTGKSDTMPRGKHTTSFIFPAFIPHTCRSVCGTGCPFSSPPTASFLSIIQTLFLRDHWSQLVHIGSEFWSATSVRVHGCLAGFQSVERNRKWYLWIVRAGISLWTIVMKRIQLCEAH